MVGGGLREGANLGWEGLRGGAGLEWRGPERGASLEGEGLRGILDKNSEAVQKDSWASLIPDGPSLSGPISVYNRDRWWAKGTLEQAGVALQCSVL